RQHAAYYLALGEAAEPQLRGPQQARWMARLEQEHNNLRAVLAWSQSAAATDGQAGELGARLSVAVWEFWSRRGYQSEGRRWLAGALTQVAVDSTEPEARRLRANVLSAAGNLALYQSDAVAGRTLLEESLALFQELGDSWGIAYVLLNLGVSYHQQDDLRQAERLIEQSLASFRTLGDSWGIAWALRFLMGVHADAAGSGDSQHQSSRVMVLLEESLVHFRAVGDLFGIAAALGSLGSIAAKQGDDRRAHVLLAESLALKHEVGGRLGVARTLMDFAGLVAAQGQQRAELERATRLYAAAEALEDSISFVYANVDGAAHQRTIAMLRTQLSEAAFAAAWAAGQAMTLEQAIADALADEAKSS
ncbi:MAG TPA: tetratricopeptide repeat protein, partial [Roseiflexaceae bacterium]